MQAHTMQKPEGVNSGMGNSKINMNLKLQVNNNILSTFEFAQTPLSACIR